MDDGAWNAPRRPDAEREDSVADLVGRLVERAEHEGLSVQDIFAMAGSRGHALALAVFALPEALPLPVAGISTLVAIPLILIAAHLVVFGSRRSVPAWIGRRRLNARVVRMVGEAAGPPLRRIEAVSRPRLAFVARRDRLLGLACLLLGIIVALPIPFWNMAPAICLLLVAMGMVQRDGLLALAGVAGAGTMVAAGVFAADVIARWVGGL